MLLNRVCCSTTSVIVSKREFKFCFFRSCSKARELIYANYLISLVHFAFRFARNPFARNSGERGGRGGGVEGGRQEKNKIYIFLSFLIHVSTHIFIALSSSHFLCSKGKYGRDGKSPIFTS